MPSSIEHRRKSLNKDLALFGETHYLAESFVRWPFGYNKIQEFILGYNDNVYPSIYSLGQNELKIFITLAEMMEHNNTVVCSSSDIADVCLLHPTAVRYSFRKLREKLYFVLKIEEIKKRSKYIINPLYVNKGDDEDIQEACNIWNDTLAVSAPELTNKYKH